MSTNISLLMQKNPDRLEKVAPIGEWMRSKANVGIMRIVRAAGLWMPF